MFRYPWYSVDSFTPVISAVWGSVLLPGFTKEGVPKYYEMSTWGISDQRDHVVGNLSSFTQYPPLITPYALKLFEDNGFTLGQITYQKKRERRGRKGENENKQRPLAGVIRYKDTNLEEKTLANHWESRMHFNLLMWNQLEERMPLYPRPFEEDPNAYKEEKIQGNKTIMYMGVSTTTHLKCFSKVKPRHNILMSYAYMTEPIYRAIQNYVK